YIRVTIKAAKAGEYAPASTSSWPAVVGAGTALATVMKQGHVTAYASAKKIVRVRPDRSGTSVSLRPRAGSQDRVAGAARDDQAEPSEKAPGSIRAPRWERSASLHYRMRKFQPAITLRSGMSPIPRRASLKNRPPVRVGTVAPRMMLRPVSVPDWSGTPEICEL